MAFQGDFSVTQNAEDTITITDNSTGSDPNLTSRTYTLKDYANNVIATGTWNISDSSITLTGVLTKDLGVNITVDWNSLDPLPDSTYSVTKLYEFDFYDMIFLGQLIAEKMARYPSIVNDTGFMNNFFKYYAYIVSARISTGLMSDIFKTQLSLDLATEMRLNQTIYF